MGARKCLKFFYILKVGVKDQMILHLYIGVGMIS